MPPALKYKLEFEEGYRTGLMRHLHVLLDGTVVGRLVSFDQGLDWHDARRQWRATSSLKDRLFMEEPGLVLQSPMNLDQWRDLFEWIIRTDREKTFLLQFRDGLTEAEESDYLASKGLRKVRSIGYARRWTKVATDGNIAEAIRKANGDPEVSKAEPEIRHQTLGERRT